MELGLKSTWQSLQSNHIETFTIHSTNQALKEPMASGVARQPKMGGTLGATRIWGAGALIFWSGDEEVG